MLLAARYVLHLRQKPSLQSAALRRVFLFLSLSSGFGHDGDQCMISLNVY